MESSRRRSSCCDSCRRKRAGACSSRPRSRELPKIYEQISDELASQYTMAYSSKNPMHNGAWRRIDVRVNRPGLTRPHQPGYYGPIGSIEHHAPGAAPALCRRRGGLCRPFRVARSARRPAGDGCSAGGVLAHTFLIGMQTVQAGHAPLVGTSAAISAFVWLLGCRTSTSS